MSRVLWNEGRVCEHDYDARKTQLKLGVNAGGRAVASALEAAAEQEYAKPPLFHYFFVTFGQVRRSGGQSGYQSRGTDASERMMRWSASSCREQ